MILRVLEVCASSGINLNIVRLLFSKTKMTAKPFYYNYSEEIQSTVTNNN